MRHVDEPIAAADLVVVPVLASIFDEGSTGAASLPSSTSRSRSGGEGGGPGSPTGCACAPATQRPDSFLERLGQPIAARLSHRAIYGGSRCVAFSIFDAEGHLRRCATVPRSARNAIEEAG
ncbi:MAG: hypothetical protein U1E17_03015 [Geminicoccaceae bacterium]